MDYRGGSYIKMRARVKVYKELVLRPALSPVLLSAAKIRAILGIVSDSL